jgi:hypothetical protein
MSTQGSNKLVSIRGGAGRVSHPPLRGGKWCGGPPLPGGERDTPLLALSPKGRGNKVTLQHGCRESSIGGAGVSMQQASFFCSLSLEGRGLG